MNKNKTKIKLSFDELVNNWETSKRSTIKKSSELLYYRIIRIHILPSFNKIKSLSQLDIDKFLLQLNEKVERKEISYKYGLDILNIFKSLIKHINKEYDFNFICSFSLKKVKQNKKIESYTLKEQKSIINNCLININNKKLGILISLFSGLRIGELCALQWNDIDFNKKVFNINKNIQRIFDHDKSYLKIDSPKTINSIREIPICNVLLNLLKKFKSPSDFFVLSNKKQPIEPRNFRKYYDSFIKKINIRKLKFHSLRHTFATTCIESGIDYKTVSELLGHSSINITMNIYVHISLDHKRKCLERLSKYIS